MIHDFDFLETGELPPTIIIGSGPAGVSLALALESQAVPSLILEAGGRDYSDAMQDTYAGTVVGDPYFDLESSRLKYFGGSSNHWSGVCRPLDSVDFQPNSRFESHIGWPITKADLDPYQARVNNILEVGPFRERPVDPGLKEIEFSFSPPVNFAFKYEDMFAASTRAHICLNANVTGLQASNGRVAKITVAHLDGRVVTIAPERVVLCMGGIENARLLLWSNQTSPEPITDTQSPLGAHWFDHPHDLSGEVTFFTPINQFTSGEDAAFFAPSEAAMAEHGILNGCVRIWGVSEAGPDGHSDDGTRKRMARSLICGSRIVGDIAASQMDTRVGCLSTAIELVWEQEARAENRVTLSDTDRDAFGIPRPVLFWEKSARDYRSAKIIMELFGRHLAETGTGELRVYDHVIDKGAYPLIKWMAGHHHMGGTRMAETAVQGVVDRNLRIFGMENAYVLGSSVFPHAGHANPTYTIVQLALRLGDHLAQSD